MLRGNIWMALGHCDPNYCRDAPDQLWNLCTIGLYLRSTALRSWTMLAYYCFDSGNPESTSNHPKACKINVMIGGSNVLGLRCFFGLRIAMHASVWSMYPYIRIPCESRNFRFPQDVSLLHICSTEPVNCPFEDSAAHENITNNKEIFVAHGGILSRSSWENPCIAVQLFSPRFNRQTAQMRLDHQDSSHALGSTNKHAIKPLATSKEAANIVQYLSRKVWPCEMRMNSKGVEKTSAYIQHT